MRLPWLIVGLLSLLAVMPVEAADPPWPTPPPDDDDPFFCRPVEADHALRVVEQLIAAPSTAESFRGNGIIVGATPRTRREGSVERYIVDFLFWLGPSERPELDRFRVTRIVHARDLTTGDLSLGTEESPEFLLARWFADPASACFANTMDALRSCYTALADAAVRTLQGTLLPYYALGSLRTPPGASYASGQTVSVTFTFVNQTNRDDRYTLIVEVAGSGGDGGGSHVKSLRTR
jgi:hypothetical protein